MATDILNKLVFSAAKITGIINTITVLFVLLCFLVFVWGFVSYSRKISEGKGESVKEYKLYMVWSLIALFVLTSIWGIIYMLNRIIFVDNFGTSKNIETIRFR